ncbi:MAG: class I SAM-dependent methyltransferase [Allosphingosinicella sp.]
MTILGRFLAAQFARPSGRLGRFVIGPWLDRISRKMNRLVIDQLDIQPSEDVLEVGFGGGALLAELLKRTSGQVVGVDLSPEMVARARRRFGSLNNLALVEGSAQRLPLPSASVDKACSVNSLYFWLDPDAAMAEFARVIRPGGQLSIGFESAAELRKWPGHRFGFRLYEIEELRELMGRASFGNFRLAEGRGRKPDVFLCLSAQRLAQPLRNGCSPAD